MENMEMVKSSESIGLVAIEEQRAIQEVQASMIVAKRFRRDTEESFVRIMTACERIGLAEESMYSFPRGNTTITGPSIRLAEVLAQNWGNLQFGIRELSQIGGVSEVEAFAWDIETNTKQIKTFKVPHVRYTRAKGNVPLKDPRDIYEMVANQGARRLRACILGIIPGDIIDAAVKKCEETNAKGDGTPFEDRVRDMLVKFDKYGVTKDMIESKLGHNVKAIVAAELTPLQKIYNSMRDGMSKREDWFEVEGAEVSDEAKDLTKAIKEPPQKTPEEVKEQIEKKNDEIAKVKFDNKEFRKLWINLKKGYRDFVLANTGAFRQASPSIQAEARSKWLRLINRGIQPLEDWPLDVKTDDQGQDDEKASQEIKSWRAWDYMKDNEHFIRFKDAYENLGHDVYLDAMRQLNLEAVTGTEDAARVADRMITIGELKF